MESAVRKSLSTGSFPQKHTLAKHASKGSLENCLIVPALAASVPSIGDTLIRRRPDPESRPACPCGGGCPRCENAEFVQAKLKIGTPGDSYEQEADRVADAVMRAPEPTMVLKPT